LKLLEKKAMEGDLHLMLWQVIFFQRHRNTHQISLLLVCVWAVMVPYSESVICMLTIWASP